MGIEMTRKARKARTRRHKATTTTTTTREQLDDAVTALDTMVAERMERDARLWRELRALHREAAQMLHDTARALRNGEDEKRGGIRPWHAAARLDRIAGELDGGATVAGAAVDEKASK